MFERKPKIVVNLSPSSADIATSNRDVARSNNKIAEELAKQNYSRDRVDISLKEYEGMKERIKELESEVYGLRSVFEQIEIPIELFDQIIPGSVHTLWSDGVPEFNKPRRRRFRVEFDVENQF